MLSAADLRTSAMRQVSRHWPVLLLVVSAGLVYVGFQLYTGEMLEDALITYRYAENLALGKGFVYNEGERVLGTTTPLLTIILALCGRAWGVTQIPAISMALMWCATLATGVLGYSALLHLGIPRAVAMVATALFYFHPAIVWSATGGMETPLVLLLMALSFHAYVVRRPTLASTALGLLVLTRPDGIVWACLLGTVVLARERQRWRAAVLPGAAVIGLWLAFAWWYFGTPVPNSIVAKSVIGQNPELGGLLSARRIWRYYYWVSEALGVPWPGNRTWIMSALLALSVPAILADRRAWALGVLVMFTVAFPLVMYAGRAPTVFPWYLLPLTWASIPVIVFALVQGCRSAVALLRLPRSFGRIVIASVVAVIAGTDLWSAVGEFRRDRAYELNERTTRQAIGTWLRDHTRPDAVVAMEAIGYQGYYSHRRVLDLAGLVSPEVVEIVRTASSKPAAIYRILSELCPDYLVLRSFEVDQNRSFYRGPLFATTAQRDYFARHYAEVRRFVAPDVVWGQLRSLTIYRRLTSGEAHLTRSRASGRHVGGEALPVAVTLDVHQSARTVSPNA